MLGNFHCYTVEGYECKNCHKIVDKVQLCYANKNKEERFDIRYPDKFNIKFKPCAECGGIHFNLTLGGRLEFH